MESGGIFSPNTEVAAAAFGAWWSTIMATTMMQMKVNILEMQLKHEIDTARREAVFNAQNVQLEFTRAQIRQRMPEYEPWP